MILQSLVLQGFKSFGKKVELDFRYPVACIVGPNGSGKSNVVEALRFVLGEQSMKSMRGKAGSDLIFKGGDGVGKVSKALVSITFDNSDRRFTLESEESKITSLDFDAITITREVYIDGTNRYSINGTEVRLRDVITLLSSINIGSSSHHIISQGQADRLLSASLKDRRQMIEDALGLRVYQVRLKQSEQKLEKTLEHMHEVELVRRELAPHLKYLTKQIERIREGEKTREQLATLYREYFFYEERLVTHRLQKEQGEYQKLVEQTTMLQTTQQGSQSPMYIPQIELVERLEQIKKSIETSLHQRRDIERAIAKIEVVIELEEQRQKASIQNPDVVISSDILQGVLDDAVVYITQAESATDIREIRSTLHTLKNTLLAFRQQHIQASEKLDTSSSLAELIVQRDNLQKQEQSIATSIQEFETTRTQIESELVADKDRYFTQERERIIAEQELKTLQVNIAFVKERLLRAENRKSRLDEDIREAVALLGSSLLHYKDEIRQQIEKTDESLEQSRRAIERLKLKVEELGAIGGEEVEREYRDTTDRDAFLAKELADLQESIASLRTLIVDLRHTLEQEFREGVDKINGAFKDYFSSMFGGGNAFLSLVASTSRTKTNDDGEEESNESQNIEHGIDIHVSLPQKKVKDLSMLSGGERSLTSIALLFAMSQVKPPPFLVLDETDAALDEANSHRYGEMLARLSKTSQLIVVTHNRETMSRADVLYGVTLDKDSSSRILSIKFQEAEVYAK